MSIVAELIKIGTCSTSDFGSGTITATFPDRQDTVSRSIPVIFAPGEGATNGMPQPGDTVVCLMLGNGPSNGVCLGVIPDDLPGTATQQGVYFPDGSHAYYDEAEKKLVVNAAGGVVQIDANGVKVDGDISVSRSVTINENLTVKSKAYFSNDCYVYYDPDEEQLVVKAKKGVRIEKEDG
ncbi:hypothetical protein NYE69_28330 [Paenibacillus sp. FSL R5-0527]|uniref:hypothetical protein n=1 Tax=Paenibacillus sp. FSL R5-0527 TaxID=2975321 RepID=UPI000979C741|nr:hypothetical protein BK140_11075 [Paenibacillus macerans]